MIIWISGAYGVGKSTLADAMAARMEKPLIFDAEEVGNAVRGNYLDCPYGFIFEDYPLGGEFCRKLLKDIHHSFRKDILVPMTLVRRESHANIIKALIREGIETHLIILEASWQSIHDRILARGGGRGLLAHEKYRDGPGSVKSPSRRDPHSYRRQDGGGIDGDGVESCGGAITGALVKRDTADFTVLRKESGNGKCETQSCHNPGLSCFRQVNFCTAVIRGTADSLPD